MSLPPELANLPPPSILEAISFDARYGELKAKLVQLFDAAGIDYDVEDLESDPAQILLQVAGFQDIHLRQRINEAIRSWFLAYAENGDLDVLAQWYDVARLGGEADDALRRRIVINIQGRSTGGTEARYRAVALGADVRVADVAVYTEGRDPTIHVAVFSSDNSGMADAALLANVDAALQAPAVRMVNDTIVVASAAQSEISVTARAWLLPQAPESTIALMESNLRRAWKAAMLLGRDPARSWITAQLQVDGVQRVELLEPATEIEMPFNQAAALGTLTILKMGRAY
ncbi:bacteriophage protein [Youhaiella tibetensis]|uniref:Uncharacterized protein n=1 Tax=Paradevosia tibetensis TaxID=1447062 RepID=A0A5B9DJ78_9HYPH|nr:baseplate J/gp47 family protein [Youhaiella tibetensis]QEE18892.1 hypothetical protein FNA67_01280 [Youhaiella tibetensis]GGF38226.1 bacteriophage protein [Youhaiella tibetensis]